MASLKVDMHASPTRELSDVMHKTVHYEVVVCLANIISENHNK